MGSDTFVGYADLFGPVPTEDEIMHATDEMGSEALWQEIDRMQVRLDALETFLTQELPQERLDEHLEAARRYFGAS